MCRSYPWSEIQFQIFKLGNLSKYYIGQLQGKKTIFDPPCLFIFLFSSDGCRQGTATKQLMFNLRSQIHSKCNGKPDVFLLCDCTQSFRLSNVHFVELL